MSALDMLHHLAILRGITNKTERTQMVEALLQQTDLWNARKKSRTNVTGKNTKTFRSPRLSLSTPNINIYPERRSFDGTGHFVLQSKTSQPMAQIHITISSSRSQTFSSAAHSMSYPPAPAIFTPSTSWQHHSRQVTSSMLTQRRLYEPWLQGWQ